MSGEPETAPPGTKTEMLAAQTGSGSLPNLKKADRLLNKEADLMKRFTRLSTRGMNGASRICDGTTNVA